MAVSKFYQLILDTLQGRTDQLRTIPPERLDWAGPGAMLELYLKTSGNDREVLIRGIGQVIQHHPVEPSVIAQLMDIASGLDLAEVEPQVRKLQTEPFGSQDPLDGAIRNYLAFHQLNTQLEPRGTRQDANGKAKAPKARPDRVARCKPAKERHISHRQSAGG
jgi:hypothetical protein